MPIVERVLRFLDPTGKARATVRQWLRGAPAAPERQPAPPATVTCLLFADGSPLLPRCDALLAQTYRPLEILVAGSRERLRDLPTRPGVRGLVVPNGMPQAEVERELAALAGDFVLTAAGSAEPELVATLLAILQREPGRDEVRGQGRKQQPGGGFCLRRNRRRDATAPPTPLAVTADTPLPTDDRPLSLHFPAAAANTEDLPYRWRAVLTRPNVIATAADATTAERVRLLQPSPPNRLRPFCGGAPRRVVLQADDFREGGMEQVIIDLAEALQTANFTVRLLILGEEGPAGARARARGLCVDRVPASFDAYRDYLDQHRPELVNAHYSTYGADQCAARGVPFVQTVHNMYVWFGPYQFDTYRKADPHTHAYVCVSNNVARYSDLTIGLPAVRMLVIPNGCHRDFLAVDAHRTAAAALRRELGLPPTARVLLNVASVQPPKGQHLLLAAFAELAAERTDAHLIVLGGTADAEYLRAQQAMTERLGLSQRVHWVGRRADVSAFHQLADALVQPSFFEGWSLAITEAVLAGLPVIATDVGGAVEQLRGTTGILVPAAAPDVTRLHVDTLMPLLADECAAVRSALVAAMREVLARDGARSPLPAEWEALLREAAYGRTAEVFHWFAAGGSVRAARCWLAAQ
ncbi:MAG: glycosyltransferase [Planctomycetes bacterium]|nr:glycosyltransferase [Planctomycetota bacterium]